MPRLVSQEVIDFAPGEDTFGLKIIKEKWETEEGPKTYWKTVRPDCVLVVAFTFDGEMVFINEFQPVAHRLLSCVGSPVKDNESPFQAAKRGLLEKAGYEGDPMLLSTIVENAGGSNRKIFYFLATCCAKEAEPKQGIDVITIRPVEFWRRFYAGLITNPTEPHDGPYTLQGVALAFGWLKLHII